MKLNASDIDIQFENLLADKTSRDDTDKWAYARMQVFDSGTLEFVPHSDERRLWSALTYLHGIDLKTDPQTYLHSLAELKDWYEQNGKTS